MSPIRRIRTAGPVFLLPCLVLLIAAARTPSGGAEVARLKSHPQSAGPKGSPVPRWEPAGVGEFPIALPKDARIDAGFLVVLEDRARPNGRTIRLPVAIVRSRSASPAPDPVVYTAGGPGSSSLNAAQYGGAYRFTDTRDLVVFEQRGTRHARPSLECPEVDAARTEGAIRARDAAGRAALNAAAADACRARLVASGVDPAAYTTAASAADLEDLRRVLGIRRWNLYGVSYSTRLMLTVLRDYPAGVRSAVLDSVLPPMERYDESVNAHLALALDSVLRDCAAQVACRSAYPDLKPRLYAALEAAEQSPVTVSVRRRTEGGKEEMAEVRLGAAELVKLIDVDDTDSLPGLPRLMDQIARRDVAALRPYVERSLSAKGFAWGMRYSVWCGEEAPHVALLTKSGAAPSSPPSALTRVNLTTVASDVCRVWRVPMVPERYRMPVKSDVPTLLIAGEYDPYTPPNWAAAAAKTLPNGRVLTLHGMAHAPTQVWGQPCAMKVAAAFVEDPGRDPALSPAGGCLSECGPPQFETGAKRP